MVEIISDPENDGANFKMIDSRNVPQGLSREAAASADQPLAQTNSEHEGVEQAIAALLDSTQLSAEQKQWVHDIYRSVTQAQDPIDGVRFQADLQRFLDEYRKSQEVGGSEQLSDTDMQALVSQALPGAAGKLRRLGAGGSRVGYLIESSGCVVRVDKSTFGASVDRLQRHRDYDYAKLIRNRLLVGDVRDFPELPMDIQEVVIPLDQAMKEVTAKNDHELVALLNEAKASNPLASQYVMEQKNTNLGLVKRQSPSGNSDLYVIAFDLGGTDQYLDKHGPQQLERICQDAQPVPISFSRAVQSIESVQNLPEEGAVDRFLHSQTA